MNPKIINKTMDINDLFSEEALVIIKELDNLILDLKNCGLKISSWYGWFDLSGDPASIEWINRGYGYSNVINSVDDKNFPWFLYWEIVWIVLNNHFQPGDTLLDMGGSSSLFSYYLASKGLKVTTIDLQEDLVANADQVTVKKGWDLENIVMDMRDLKLNKPYNHITSICVFEHIPLYQRIAVSQDLKHILLPGGSFSITFDYRNPVKTSLINSPEDIRQQFIEPSGLAVRGNPIFYDNGISYLLQPFYSNKALYDYKKYLIALGHMDPTEFEKTKDVNDYTFGALFLEKI